MSESLREMDTMEHFDESHDLVDPNMIPTAASEVVMDGEGNIEEDYNESNDPYQYDDYTYGDEQEVVNYEEVDTKHLLPQRLDELTTRTGNWATDQKNRMELLEVLETLPQDLHGKFYEFVEGKGISLEKRPEDHHYLYGRNEKNRYYSAYGDDSRDPYQFNPGDLDDDPDYMNNTSSSNPAYQSIYDKNQQPQATRMCPGCNMVLRRSVYYHHARMIRDKGACNLFTPQRFPCPQCDAKIGTLEKLCQHMEQIHNAPTQIRTSVFTSEDDFKQFRIDLEGKGGNFRMARGNKKSKKGVVQYFRCNRLQTLAKNQTFRPCDNPIEDMLPNNRKRGKITEVKHTSAKQVIRTENSCTAFYNKAYLENGTIEVRYCDHHLHDDEKMRMPDAVRMRAIDLAKKHLPHVVILMIIKDERHKYCEKDSANDRKIQEMKTQDIRQVLAGINRQERTKAMREEMARNQIMVEEDGKLVAVDPHPEMEKPWNDIKPIQKVIREELSPMELRYLDLFDNNREEIMARFNERSKVENDKKLLFDSFVHRISSSQDMIKSLAYERLVPSEETYDSLKEALSLLTKIEEELIRAKRNPVAPQEEYSSFIELMEVHDRQGMEQHEMDEIDVVGIEEEEYDEAAMEAYREREEIRRMGLDEDIEQIEEDGEYIIEEETVLTTERNAEDVRNMSEEDPTSQIHEEEVENLAEEMHVEEIPAEMFQPEEGEEGSSEPQISRAGRVIKKNAKFED